MTNLEIWKGLDFKGYQEGDVIILPDEGMMKMFYYGGGEWRWFYDKLKDVGAVLKLGPMIECVWDDELGKCYKISFLSYLPPTMPRPDMRTSLARKMIWSKDEEGWEENNAR